MQLNQDIIEKAKKVISSAEFSKLILNTKINEDTSHKKEVKNLFKFYKDDEISFNEQLCREFILFCLAHLELNDNLPDLTVVISGDKEKFKTFAFYTTDTKIAAVYGVGRHILDVFRSLAHELVHFKQDINNEISQEEAGDENDGVRIENEANSVAGVIMRKYGREHPELY